jgi:hypothetical protein
VIRAISILLGAGWLMSACGAASDGDGASPGDVEAGDATLPVDATAESDASSAQRDASRSQADSGEPAVDAAPPASDAAEPVLDAAPPAPDAAPPVPDAAPPVPDAAPPDPDAGPALVTIYVEPDGDDALDGATADTAVATLERVHALLSEARPDAPVDVRIGPGLYRGQRVEWRYTHPEHPIRFVRRDPEADRPVFDGCLADGDCPGGTWFTLRQSNGQLSNLEFEYLRVERYGTAISFNGDRNRVDGYNGGNRIYGCYFDRIGNVFNEDLDPSTAAVRFVNSVENEVANSHFVDVINTRSGGLIHALYIAHLSRDARIERNRFLRSTGDPVRIRDFSNGAIVRDNVFIRTGTHGYTDWYCDHDARKDCTKPEPECPSWDGQFRDNTLDGTWDCDELGVWRLYQDDETTGCAPPREDARRVRTSGNVRTDVPCSMD